MEGSHFIIGVDIITKKIKFIILILLIISCASVHKKEKQKLKRESEISIRTQHWNTDTDSLNLYMRISLPHNHFVFKKNIDHFSSAVIFTLIISDREKNTQMYRKSWKEEIIESYYNDTRDPDNYFKTEKNLSLLPGTYNLFLNIQDQDSRKNWKIVKEINLERVNYISPSFLFIKEKNGKFNQTDFIIQKTDTIWLRTQVNLPDTSNQKIKYTIIYNESIIDSAEVVILDSSIQNVYYIPIPFTQNKRGRYQIELSFLKDKQTTSFSYGYYTKNYWTDDIDEVVGVMRYILPYSEYKKLIEKEDSEKWNLVNKYWRGKDPSEETDENELLIELNERVRFSNKKFSILMHGWRSDRGRIYIIYGEPHIVDESYQDNMGYNYQKWVYSNGKEFIFIDRTMSGDYTLYQERF